MLNPPSVLEGSPILLAWGHGWSFSEFLSWFPGPCWKHIINSAITPLSPKISMYNVLWNHYSVKEYWDFLPSLFHTSLTIDFMIFWWVNRVLGHKENVKLIYLYYFVNFAVFSMLLVFLFYFLHHRTDKLHLLRYEKDNEWLFTEMSSSSGAGLIGIKIKICKRLTKPIQMAVFGLLQKFSVSPSVLQHRQHYCSSVIGNSFLQDFFWLQQLKSGFIYHL